MNAKWLSGMAMVGVVALVVAGCGSDEDDGGGSSGAGGAAGSSSGGSAGSAGSSTGGSGGSSTGGSAGTAGNGGSAGSTANCTDFFGDDADCKTCLTTNCCAQSAVCEAAAECKALTECFRTCPDPNDTTSQCVMDCVDAHPNGAGAYNNLVICRSNNCSVECAYL